MAIGCFILGASFVVMIAGAKVVGDGKGSLFWPLFCTFLVTIGELYLSPIGLSLVTKLSPARVVSTIMGAWFLATAFSHLVAAAIAKMTGVSEGGEGSVIPPPSETVGVYGNVFGGENLIHTLGGIAPYIVPAIAGMLEVLVGLIQAFVFTLLSAVYIGLICNHDAGHDEEHAH